MDLCSKVSGKLPLYLDGELSTSDMEIVAIHLATCPKCQEALLELTTTISYLNDLEEVDLPPNYHAELMDKINNLDYKNIRKSVRTPFDFNKVYRYVSYAAASFVVVGLTSSYFGFSSINIQNQSFTPESIATSYLDSSDIATYSDDYSDNSAMGIRSMPDSADETHLGEPIGDIPDYSQMDNISSISEMNIADNGDIPSNSMASMGRSMMDNTSESFALDSYVSSNVRFNIETTDIDLCLETIKNLAIKDINTYKTFYDDNSYVDMNVLVDSNINYDDMKAVLSNVGNISYEVFESFDYKNDYTFYQAKLNSANSELLRLTELLNASEDLSTLIYVEGRMSSLQSEIDSYKGELNRISDMVSSTNASFSIFEVQDVVPHDMNDLGFKMSNGFIGSFTNSFSLLQDIFIFICYAMLPFGLFLSFVLIAIKVFVKSKKLSKGGK